MPHPFKDYYLNDAQRLLANAFDYAINDCGIDADDFGELFASSFYSKQYELGNPSILSGMSGVEFARLIIGDDFKDVEPILKNGRTPAYWVGWAISYYQWQKGASFTSILRKIPLSEIISMYNVYHEMDVLAFVEEVDRRFAVKQIKTNLEKIRRANNLSQNQLAVLSGVNIRSIQLYEQKVNDIDKAQAHTLFKLAKVLNCEIENLLENPF